MTTLPPKRPKVANEKQSTASSVSCCEWIREAAYYKWEAAGCPCGDGVEFWLQAEAELATEPPSNEANNS